MRRIGDRLADVLAWLVTAPLFWNVRTDATVTRWANDTAGGDES